MLFRSTSLAAGMFTIDLENKTKFFGAVALARLVAATGFGLLWYAVGPRVAMLAVCVVLLAAIPAGLAVMRRAVR